LIEMGVSVLRGVGLGALVAVFIAGLVVGYYVALHVAGPGVQQPAAPEGGVFFLPDSAYYGNLTYYLDRANKSVYVVMYVVKYDPRYPDDPVNKLLRKLVDLYKKGVDVRVVVDDQTLISYPDTINYLVQNGVPVKLDESKSVTTHAKIVIIDGKYVFIGSHNWTESALTKNHETTLLVDSTKLAEEVTNYFESIWSSGRPPA
jgi:phosphatidylserine/phosphatidylglycerophosphate/cardiolipin synthase-like enzyme